MHKLDLTIARLRLLLAEVAAKRDALANTRGQYREQIAHLISVTVYEEVALDRTMAMIMDVDARLREVERQDQYLDRIRARAQRELDSLQLTKLIEEARVQLAALRARQQAAEGTAGAESAGGAAELAEADLAAISLEIRRLEEVIAVASGAAAKSISGE